jgi:hypothetical protein
MLVTVFAYVKVLAAGVVRTVYVPLRLESTLAMLTSSPGTKLWATLVVRVTTLFEASLLVTE